MNGNKGTCNKKCLLETSVKLNEQPAMVGTVINEYSKFIAMIIRRGAFEGVEIPNFGKFKAKPKYVQMQVISRSIKKPVIKRPKYE